MSLSCHTTVEVAIPECRDPGKLYSLVSPKIVAIKTLFLNHEFNPTFSNLDGKQVVLDLD